MSLIQLEKITETLKAFEEYSEAKDTGNQLSRILSSYIVHLEHGNLKDFEFDATIEKDYSEVLLSQEGILEKIGVAPVLHYTKSGTVFTKDGDYPREKILLRILDADLLMAFLSVLPSEGVKSVWVVTQLCKLLTEQLIECYSKKDLSKEELQVLTHIEKLGICFSRFDLGEALVEFLRVEHIHRSGYLREYLYVKRHDLLMSYEEGFGPHRWPEDITKELLQKKWDTAVEGVQQCKLNPSAHALGQVLKGHLLEAATFSMNTCIDQWEERLKSIDMLELEGVIFRAKQKIQKVSF